MNSGTTGNGRPLLRLVRRDYAGEGASSASSPEQRFPPAVQVLNMTVPHIQERMQAIAMMGFRRGLDSESICDALSAYARALGYNATIGIHEVRTDQMPSFSGGTVASALMLIDLNPRPSLSGFGKRAAGGRE